MGRTCGAGLAEATGRRRAIQSGSRRPDRGGGDFRPNLRTRMMQEWPKRILMTADTVGGVWCYATELIRALEPYGIEVLLATMGRPVSKCQAEEIADLTNVE